MTTMSTGPQRHFMWGYRPWTLVWSAGLIVLGAWFFSNPEVAMSIMGIEPQESVDNEAFTLVFRWLGWGPIGLGFFVFMVGSAAAAKRRRDAIPQGFLE